MENDLEEPRSLENTLTYIKYGIWFSIVVALTLFAGHSHLDYESSPHNHQTWEILEQATRAMPWLGLLAFYVVKVGGSKYIRNQFAPKVASWAKSRYGLELTDEQAKLLATRVYLDKESSKQFFYYSPPLVLWKTNANGMRYTENIFLLGVEGEMILFDKNSQEELDTLESKDYQAFFHTLWSEVREHGGLFTFREETSDRERSTPKVFMDNGAQAYAFWSDELRIELYKNSFLPTSEIGYIPISDFAQYVLPQMVEKGVLVGFNWGEENRSFEAQEIENMLA